MDFLWIMGIIAGYLALQLWILPRLGIPTCMSNSCSVEQRKKEPAVLNDSAK